MKVGVAGCGVGRAHIRSFQSLPACFTVEAVCDLDEKKARQVAAEFGIPSIYMNFDQLCHQPDLDVIDICTPPNLHYPQAQQALAAGKHVICEKPLVGSLMEIDRLLLAEQESGKRVMPIFQYRFGHGLQKLKMLVDKGVAGQLYLSTVEVAWRRRLSYYASSWRGKWSTELGGILLNHAIHALDMLYLVSGPARSVFARTATLVNPIEVEDCASASFLMANGSLATLAVTLGSTHEISRHRFCFSNLTAESNSHPYTNSEDPWSFTGDSAEASQQIKAALAEFKPEPSGFEGQFKLFYEALAAGSQLPVTLGDARRVLEIITAMYYSAQTGQAVELPISEDHAMYAG